jgi:hypothetical protein
MSTIHPRVCKALYRGAKHDHGNEISITKLNVENIDSWGHKTSTTHQLYLVHWAIQIESWCFSDWTLLETLKSLILCYPPEAIKT